MFDKFKFFKLSGILPNESGNEYNKGHKKNSKNIMTDSSAHKAKHIKNEVNHRNINPQKIEQKTGHEITYFEPFCLRLYRLFVLLLLTQDWDRLLLGQAL